MVTVVNFEKRQSSTGNEFHALILQGGVEMVRSAETGQFYATVKRCSIPSTLDQETCEAMIGEKLEGSIQKVQCEPYEYVVEDTGEVLELSHRWSFVPVKTEERTLEKAREAEFKSIEDVMA